MDIRPKFDLPELNGLPVTVEDADVKPEQVEEYLGALRERFASLKGADRPVEDGDYVSIDLSAEVDGEPVEDAQASGISYEVGSGSMLDGLDEALPGMSAGDTKTFTTELAGGTLEGQDADVTVTVHSVKVKELPELDDDFAQSASEFDTIEELREGTREQLEMMQRGGQAQQARDACAGRRAGAGRHPAAGEPAEAGDRDAARETLDDPAGPGLPDPRVLHGRGRADRGRARGRVRRRRPAGGEGAVRAGQAGHAGAAGHRPRKS